MSDNSKKTVKGKQFEPGKSGNPGGRPKKTEEEINLIEACKEKTPAALTVIEDIMNNSQNDKNRLSAALAIIERAYGKPVQPTENKHDGKFQFGWLS